MTRPLLIKNGCIIDPSQNIDKKGDLLIKDGMIASLDDKLSQADYDIFDAQGMVVCPGFIDLHCHLREPGYEDKETIASGGKAAAAGGFTTICCMPNTDPPLDDRASIEYVFKTAAKASPVRVLPIGCITRGREGKGLAEMGELADTGVIGYSDDGDSVMDSNLLLKAMRYSLAFGLPLIEHCEDKSLSEGGQINEGITATRLGLQGIPAAAEEVIISRDIALAKESGARLHIAHVSTRGGAELIRRAKEKGIKITAEVTPHHLTLTEEAALGYYTNAKVNPPLRTEGDIKALIEGLKDGTIDAIATDHAPHTENDKRREFALAPFGISGFETALGSLMGLVHDGRIDLNLLISKLTVEPAKIVGKELGTLKVGATADITVFNPDEEWTVDTGKFLSKGKNTPLNGKKLKGRVKAVIAGGKLIYNG